MRKLFLDNIEGEKIVITGDEHKHIAYSLRMRKGNRLTVCSGGVNYTAVITEITKNSTTAQIVEQSADTSEPKVDITLFYGAMKGSDRNEFVIQKCTELGVKKFVPFISEFSAVGLESVKTERLNRIALEAAKQSGRGFVPPVLETLKFNYLLDLLQEYDFVVFPYENEQVCGLKEKLAKYDGGKIAVVIGSEGGFSVREAEALRKIAGESVSLGNRILRAETASVAVISVLMYETGEWTR